jgi:hypothetical protein
MSSIIRREEYSIDGQDRMRAGRDEEESIGHHQAAQARHDTAV